MSDQQQSPAQATQEFPSHLQQLEQNLKDMARTRAIYSLIGIGIVALIVYVGMGIAENSNATSFWVGITKVFDYPKDMTAQAIESGSGWFNLLIKYQPDLWITINIALFSTGLAFLFAVILSLFASENMMPNAYIRGSVRRLLDLLRAFPEIGIALVLLYAIGNTSVMPAVIAITLHTIGALGKLFSEAVENVDNKPIEGLASVGSSWFARARFGVLPQVLPLFFSYGLMRLEINVRASAILGFFGGGGIGKSLNTVIQWRYGADIVAIIVLLVATIVALDYLSTYLRSRLAGNIA